MQSSIAVHSLATGRAHRQDYAPQFTRVQGCRQDVTSMFPAFG